MFEIVCSGLSQSLILSWSLIRAESELTTESELDQHWIRACYWVCHNLQLRRMFWLSCWTRSYSLTSPDSGGSSDSVGNSDSVGSSNSEESSNSEGSSNSVGRLTRTSNPSPPFFFLAFPNIFTDWAILISLAF